MVQEVPGVIIILTCAKYIHERLPRHRPSKTEYAGWPIVYCLGKPAHDKPFSLLPSTDNGPPLLVVRCEDTYMHLLKKVDLAIHALQTMYKMEKGVIKVGDDMFFNDELVEQWVAGLGSDDYVGHNYSNRSLKLGGKPMNITKSCVDMSMMLYYKNHPLEAWEIQAMIPHIPVQSLIHRPDVPICPIGTVYYLSNRAISALHAELESVHHNIFYRDPTTGAFNYFIEDVALVYTMLKHGIDFTNVSNLFTNAEDFDQGCIFTHTAIQGKYIEKEGRVGGKGSGNGKIGIVHTT